jgi:hypothetical protein
MRVRCASGHAPFLQHNPEASVGAVRKRANAGRTRNSWHHTGTAPRTKWTQQVSVTPSRHHTITLSQALSRA